MIEKDDWRLLDQESYLADKTLRFCKWESNNPDYDHEHCRFCWAKFPNEFPEGYVTTENRYWWICPTCYEDFKEMFRWKLVD